MADIPPSSAPQGYHSVMPHLVIEGAAAAIEYYQTVFNATERMRVASPDGKIWHAQILVSGSLIMISDACPEIGTRSPLSFGGSPVSLYLQVKNVDVTVDRALVHGATLVSAVRDQFYGSRSGMIIDPFGHQWHIATRIEEVSLEEIQKRGAALMSSGSCS